MGDFNFDLVKSGTHGPTSAFLEGFTSVGFYPLISLPTRLTDDNHDRPGTATLIDNIWTNNVAVEMVSGVVTVRISDHLPVFSFVGGGVGGPEGGELGGRWRRKVNEGRIGRFAGELRGWDFDEKGPLGREGKWPGSGMGFGICMMLRFPGRRTRGGGGIGRSRGWMMRGLRSW